MNKSSPGEELGNNIEEEESNESAWLSTFADISLLLLAFFVLLYSMSSIEQKKFNNSFLSVRNALGTEEGGKRALKAKFSDDSGVHMKKAKLLKQLQENQKQVFSEFNFYSAQEGMEGVVGGRIQSGKVILRVPGDVLFGLGKVHLTEEGKKVIKKLKDFFVKHNDQTINIKGHTDNVPPKSGARFKDNWEISALRAINVLRFLKDLGIEPNRMTATGLADLDPLVPNINKENRAKNRRVEFILTKTIEDIK